MEPQDNPAPSRFSMEVAEQVLVKIYGPDLHHCQVTPEQLAPIIQEALNAEVQKEKTVVKLLVQVLEQVLTIATPPPKSEIADNSHLARVLGERADGIHHLVSQTLAAWKKYQSNTQ